MTDWSNDIEKYKRGELSPKEMHELEKRALSDSFLADALEGVASISAENLTADLAEINRAVRATSAGSRHVYFTPLRIAAGVVILIGAGLFLLWPSNRGEQLAENNSEKTQPQESAKPATDSVPKKESDQQLTLAEETKQPAPKKDQKQLRPKQADTTIPKVTGETAAASAVDTAVAAENVTRDTKVARFPGKTDSTAAAAVAIANRISGTVTVAEDGLPLPGVTIVVKGTRLGTTTDINGHYSLNVPDSTSLIFSFVGMQTNEIATTHKSTIDVKMNEDVSQLSEVVITRSALARPVTDEPIVILAEPVGGIKAYDKYMLDNLRYPQQALDNDVKGRVVLEFNIGADGSLNNFVVMRSLGFGCDDEVIRLIKEGPTWRPTTEDNKPVESSVRVRIKFDSAKRKKR